MRGVGAGVLCAVLVACTADATRAPAARVTADRRPPPVSPAAPAAHPSPPPAPPPPLLVTSAALPWRFAIVADLHSPKKGGPSPRLQRLVAHLIALRPRFVVIAGDSTNGNLTDSRGTLRKVPQWWRALRAGLAPLREHGIPVLPVAGNHDTALPAHQAAYLEAFRDLSALAAPLVIRGAFADSASQVDRAPFSYSVDVDDVHLTLAHLPSRRRGPSPIDAWLAADLSAAAAARLRFVFAHAPLASVLLGETRPVRPALGSLLVSGRVDAYFAGHEHLLWDEDVTAAGGTVRQVMVGVGGSGLSYGPHWLRQLRAGCRFVNRAERRCRMPNGQYPFTLIKVDEQRRPPTQKQVLRWIPRYTQTFVMVEVNEHGFQVVPWAIDDAGALVRFSDE